MAQFSPGSRRKADASGALPVELTRFIGRRSEQALACEGLTRSRLVTLAGIGGVGKTRLALEVAASVADRYDEVRLVRLADVLEPALVGHTINTALGVRESSARWKLETVVEFLEERTVLLVLDNCEHLVDEVAVLADRLLRACPGLSILATSRQVMDVEGEAVVQVPPLSVLPTRGPGAGAVSESEAVSLFLDRAAVAVPGLSISAEERSQIADLCRLLDGIPLAIELAAVRLRLLPLHEVVARTADRFRFLTHGTRTAPARHQTLRASIDGTYEVCTPTERQLWSRLSVFSGGFSLEAAETIASSEEVPRDSMLDLISGLADKSIVTRVIRAGEPRYAILETIRQYGAEHLSAEDAAELGRRHREWFAGLAERVESEWAGPGQAEWLSRLRSDYPNLRAALQSCLVENPQLGMRLAWGIENFWLARGFLSEARLWLDGLLAADLSPTLDRGRALRLNSWLAVLQGDHAVVPAMLEEAGGIAKAAGFEVLAAYVTQAWGLWSMFQGDLADSLVELESAVQAFADIGHLTGEIHTSFELGIGYGFAGDTELAAKWHRRCQQLAGDVGEAWWSSFSLWADGLDKWRQGDIESAEALQRQSLRIKRTLDDQLGIGVCIEAMAGIAAVRGDFTLATRLLGAAETVLHRVGMPIEASRSMWDYHNETVEILRRSVIEPRLESAYAEGASWDTDLAVALALGEETGEAANGDQPLTKRELEVAELVARGYTNRQIGSTLYISVRTAEKHVDHILSKMNLSNRAQLAAWTASQIQAVGKDRLQPHTDGSVC